MIAPDEMKAFALDRAASLGLACAGVAPASASPHAQAYRQWIAAGRHASMTYMAQNVQQRCDVRVGWPWARSVLCVAAGYAPTDAGAPGPIARYARGRDYHRVLRRLCRSLADELIGLAPALQTHVCVDSAPVLERDLAAMAGLGWIGRNGCLIHPTFGSYLFLAEVLLSVELPPDAPMDPQCGSCRLCMDACPNSAIVRPGVVDAGRCNSWATVEHRGRLDGDVLDLRGHLFGCDVCQQVCPFNRAVDGGMPELSHPRPIAEVDVLTVLDWSAQAWDQATRGSSARRAKHEMFLRNAAIVAGQTGLSAARGPLRRLLRHEQAAVSSAAGWALDRLGDRRG